MSIIIHRKCDTVKPADEFYHIKSSSDGLASNCKACAVQIANSTRKHFVPEPTVEHKVIGRNPGRVYESSHLEYTSASPCFARRMQVLRQRLLPLLHEPGHTVSCGCANSSLETASYRQG
jgi:hypothetical protein